MKSLIKITEQNGQKAVSARELYQFLGVGRDFSNWIKSRIEEYGFVENQDFEVFAKIGENSNGRRPLKEYALSLDMAKELSMVEKTEKGKQARRYFIEVEKEARVHGQKTIGNTPTLKGLEKTKREKVLISRIKEERFELICHIRQYMKRGDMAQVARELGYCATSVQDVMLGRQWNEDVVRAMYQKVIKNKQQCLFDVREMINELNS